MLNLNMAPSFIDEGLALPWKYEINLAENMPEIVKEFRKTRNLYPIRIVLHGPPYVGKTTLAKALCKKYGFHHVTVNTMIGDTVEQLVRECFENHLKLC